MAQCQVITTLQALEQLKAIEDYLREIRSIETATYVVDGLVEAIASLEQMPERYPLVRTIKKTKHSYRFAPKWAYKVVCRVQETPPTVFVITIVHSHRNPQWLEGLLE